jgi:hypothetical protein
VRDLDTGDLLFPRLSDAAKEKLKNSLTPQNDSMHIDIDSMLANPRVTKLLINILTESGIDDLLKDWFNGDALKEGSKFKKDPLIGLLLNLLASNDVSNEVFIGHVGIVLREREHVYVIECNITSYSHYRVSIHPYHVPSDADECSLYLNEKYAEYLTHNDPEQDTTDYGLHEAQATGWVNRRAAKLEHVWYARPKGLDDDMKKNLASAAKELHGRPYGFFDHPQFGNDDRMYCSEYVCNAFKNGISPAKAPNLTDKMTWEYIEAYLSKVNNKKMLSFVQDILKDTKNQYKIKPGDTFFVLPPAILWNSSGLEYPPKLLNGRPYAPEIDLLFAA